MWFVTNDGCHVRQVDGYFFVNNPLEKLMFDELRQSCNSRGFGGFLPAMKQIANVAALPGIVSVSCALGRLLLFCSYGCAVLCLCLFFGHLSLLQSINDPKGIQP